MCKIDQRRYIISSYQNQPCQTSPINTNEQTSEPQPTATSNDTNKHLEPIVLYTHIDQDQNPKITYFMKTTLSYISFWISDPTFISLQSDPFLISITAPGYEKHNINTNLLQDNHKPLPSPSLIQRNTKDTLDELSKLKISKQITMELFKDFRLPRQKNET